MGWSWQSFRCRRTVATGGVATLLCTVVSVMFLIFAGYKQADTAQNQVTDAWNRVVPLIRQGPLPEILDSGEVSGIQVVDDRGHVVAATRNLAGAPPIASFRAPDTQVTTARVLCPPPGMHGCMTVFSYRVFQPQGPWVLYIAVPTIPWYGQTASLLLAVGVSVLIIAILTGWTYRDLTRAISPVNAIRAELAEITATDLGRRVPVPAKYEEIRYLAETVNDTLDRLEEAYARQRRFTADASHDLRTPVTAMRTRLEEALLHPEDADWPRTAEAVLSSVDRLHRLVTDLLSLAQLDARTSLHSDPTDLRRLVATELDHREHRKKIVKDLPESVVIDCDRLRIARLLGNLLDNAERHATSQISVSVRRDPSAAVVEVVDDGAGIATEDRKAVFDRFTRLDAGYARDANGTGLGLAIAREIAMVHGGTLTIEDSDRGARFVLRLPTADRQVPA